MCCFGFVLRKAKKPLILVSLSLLLLLGLVALLQTESILAMLPVPNNNDTTKYNNIEYNGKYGRNRSGSGCPKRISGDRVNVILIGHGRSGTSFLGQLFNQNPEVFYHFEPLDVVEKMNKPKLASVNYSSKQNKLYVENAFHVLSAIFRCEFVESDEITSRFLRYYSDSSFIRSQSRVVAKLSKANAYLDSRLMNDVCRALPKYTVVKLLVPRLPGGRIANLLPLMRKLGESQFKVIHVIRDPRAVVNSQLSLRWFKDSMLENAAKTICGQTMLNLANENADDVLFRCNYMRIDYEAMVTSPQKVTQDLYNFIGMTSSLEVEQWVKSMTTLSRDDIKNAEQWRYSQRKNATLVIEKWKSAPPERNSVIEKECGDVVKEMGYKRITGV